MICTACGYVGRTKRITKGSLFTELLLYFLLILPGLMYTTWRLTSRYNGCPKCLGDTMIPTDTPIGRRLLQDNPDARA